MAGWARVITTEMGEEREFMMRSVEQIRLSEEHGILGNLKRTCRFWASRSK